MSAEPPDHKQNRRILVVDDNEAIHADFRKILIPEATASPELLAAEAELFGESPAAPTKIAFELATATSGKAGCDLARRARDAGSPFAVAFVDMRMPPGWDGIETIEHLWELDADLEVVICTAFSDHSWQATIRRLGQTDQLLVVKKPFDTVEVLQVATALTQKWNLRRQARRALSELDAIVRERTTELESARDALLASNRDLAAAKDAAEAANQSKSLFLANVSHELRTPLTAIVGYTEAVRERLQGRPDSEFDCEALQIIHRNAQHLVLVIGDLLDVSKLGAGMLQVESIPCSPLEVVRDVVALLHPKALEKSIELTLRAAADVPPVIDSDPLRLRQILLNLIDNAIKFTSAGTVTVDVASAPATEKLVFTIRDQGVGMSPETLKRLFRPFQQADSTTTRKYGGTGLGLVISQQLAALLGGGIEVQSQLGLGSTFTVRVAGTASTAKAATDSRGVGRECTPVPLQGTRVLVVEDGKDNQRLIAHILRKVGTEVTLAEHGEDCLRRIGSPSEHRFDLVLMDIQMPVMDGLTATRELRRLGHRLPIVALSASVMHADRQACVDVGCTEFLAKPIDRSRLFETIARLVPQSIEAGPSPQSL